MNGQMLKKVRLFLQVSQQDMAELFGIDQSTLSKIENGLLPITPVRQNRIFKTLQQKYGITTVQLLELEQAIKKVNQRNERGIRF
ncbi:helix-turn-helix domain-containing protein [Gottfriedia acidiceleris]|uniref:Helix-turn-helix domain-containing protein n=1 Tax=Gottfriedia acidiceleris TaxID=371036 RepID=A0ABY4JH02_9BACI|nr:helix-turn-helix transcriptional regulator [Gottfriedia acidiceleris]UPM53104.1 helix-turn-helix domain-containing protein [Gottfriedia acidiceleris]